MSAPHKEHPSTSALLGAKDKPGTLVPLMAGAVLLLGAAVLSIGLLSGGSAGSAPQGSPVASRGPGGPALVRPVTVGSGDLLRERRLPGELVAERRAALNAEVGGQLTRVERRLGEAVKKGELLVVIAAGVLPAELRRAEAQADAQQARADRARIVSEQQARNLQRREALHQEGAVSLGELDVARTDARTAEVEPAGFRLQPLGGALRARPAFAVLAHPGAVMVAIDADGRQVTDPFERRHGGEDRLPRHGQHRILAVLRPGRDHEVRRFGQKRARLV
jgi:multidrug efflux pump subunit AcrA (membrane-fusion protein)